MSARDVPTVMAVADDHFRRPTGEWLDHHIGRVPQRLLGEKHAFAARKRLRPTLVDRAGAGRAEDGWCPTRCRDAGECVASRREDNRVVVSPGAGVDEWRVTQGDRGAATHRDLLQLAAGEERNPS